jgi:hypothetical protein
MTPVALSGDAIGTGGLKARVWHESLTPAQEMVCRWVWDKCGRHDEPWEQFEVGFLYDYNISHELADWVRIAMVFTEFVERHPCGKTTSATAPVTYCTLNGQGSGCWRKMGTEGVVQVWRFLGCRRIK